MGVPHRSQERPHPTSEKVLADFLDDTFVDHRPGGYGQTTQIALVTTGKALVFLTGLWQAAMTTLHWTAAFSFARATNLIHAKSLPGSP
jgi:hypothetical protein